MSKTSTSGDQGHEPEADAPRLPGGVRASSTRTTHRFGDRPRPRRCPTRPSPRCCRPLTTAPTTRAGTAGRWRNRRRACGRPVRGPGNRRRGGRAGQRHPDGHRGRASPAPGRPVGAPRGGAAPRERGGAARRGADPWANAAHPGWPSRARAPRTGPGGPGDGLAGAAGEPARSRGHTLTARTERAATPAARPGVAYCVM